MRNSRLGRNPQILERWWRDLADPNAQIGTLFGPEGVDQIDASEFKQSFAWQEGAPQIGEQDPATVGRPLVQP
jgi:hypothetical protein